MAEIAKVRYTHDAMIDFIIANPALRQNDIAKSFGMSVGWISQVFSSDLFQKRLAERKAQLVDPTIVASLEEGFAGVARRSMQVVMEKLDTNPTMDSALQAMAISSKALGYGARGTGAGAQVSVQNNVVVMVPQKSANSEEWEGCYGAAPAPLGPIIQGN